MAIGIAIIVVALVPAGGIATQMADAAESIAAHAGADVRPGPLRVLRGLLLTAAWRARMTAEPIAAPASVPVETAVILIERVGNPSPARRRGRTACWDGGLPGGGAPCPRTRDRARLPIQLPSQLRGKTLTEVCGDLRGDLRPGRGS